jgi:imidazolonepropionase-like amidohydrolase
MVLSLGLGFSLSGLQAETKIFRNFTLIDGTGRAPQPASALVAENGKITWVGRAADLKPVAGAQVIDCAGGYIMPGLINIHGHPGITAGLTMLPSSYTLENVEHDLHTYAAYGVTTVLSLGMDKDLIFKIRDQQRASRPSVTRVYTAGAGLIAQGTFGGLEGLTPAVKNPAEADQAVAALAAKKVDIVKFWMDDHFGTQPKMPYDIAQAIISGAHRRGLRAAAHLFYLEDAKRLVDMGLDALAHEVRDKPIDQELIAGMKKHGAWLLSPTLSREESVFIYADSPPFLQDPFFLRGVSPDVVKTLESPEYRKTVKADPQFAKYPGYLEMAEKNLKILADAGIKFGMGTDSGASGRFPGYFEHWELELMVQSGLSPAQVIQAATKSGAEFLRAKDLGTLEPGKWADLIVLERNPLEDIRNTRTIKSVYIAGNAVQPLH